MITQRQIFLKHLAQTSPEPLMMNFTEANGIYLYDEEGKAYIDLISGISVSNLGHRNKKINEAIKNQTNKHLHLMVYGEYVQEPQTSLAHQLKKVLPSYLDRIFLVNSGSEATEGAMKLAKRFTGKHKIVAFENAYHGSTHGALSLMSNEYYRNKYRPLLPEIYFAKFNDPSSLKIIDSETAAVIIEPVQAEAGIVTPESDFLKKVEERCKQHKALLILDEIQTGFGRTGDFFAFQKFGIQPDILTIGKAFGGGMPLGAFIASNSIMKSLSHDPILGHITTFGGHPVSCAASVAAIKQLRELDYIKKVTKKETLFKKELGKSKYIKQIRSCGLLIGIELKQPHKIFDIINDCIKDGVIVDWFLYNTQTIRIAPPLIITKKEIKRVCSILLKNIEKHSKRN